MRMRNRLRIGVLGLPGSPEGDDLRNPPLLPLSLPLGVPPSLSICLMGRLQSRFPVLEILSSISIRLAGRQRGGRGDANQSLFFESGRLHS